MGVLIRADQLVPPPEWADLYDTERPHSAPANSPQADAYQKPGTRLACDASYPSPHPAANSTETGKGLRPHVRISGRS